MSVVSSLKHLLCSSHQEEFLLLLGSVDCSIQEHSTDDIHDCDRGERHKEHKHTFAKDLVSTLNKCSDISPINPSVDDFEKCEHRLVQVSEVELQVFV